MPGDPGAGITDVLIPGVRVTTYLQSATDAAGAKAAAQVYSFSQQSPSPYLQGEVSGRAGSQPHFHHVGRASAHCLDIRPARSRTSAGLAHRRLTPADRADFRVSASSTWDSLPELGPDNLFDPASGKPWLAAATDTQPQLEISWHGIRTIRKVVLEPVDGLAAAPTGVLIGSPAAAGGQRGSRRRSTAQPSPAHRQALPGLLRPCPGARLAILLQASLRSCRRGLPG